MKHRKVILSDSAARSLNHLLKHLEANWSENVKKKFVQKLDKRIEIAKRFPEAFPKSEFKKGLHKCVVTKQNTFYFTYNKKEVQIIAIFDSRQSTEKLKDQLLM